MSLSVPILLAVAGTGLMAVAIFVPFRGDDAAEKADLEAGEPASVVPRWPTLVGPSAAACDVHARLDLVDALASLGSPWALDVLHRASGDEPDPAVRAAIDAALTAVVAPSASLAR